MMKNEQKREELFFPYYINQSRLLDIYAILNGGYTEYAEITSSESYQDTVNLKGEMSSNIGFKLLNIGSNVAGNDESTDHQAVENKEKKIQTITSILSIVKKTLEEKGYLVDIISAKPGQYICIPVELKINSLKSFVNELLELNKLSNEMTNIKETSNKGTSKTAEQIMLTKIDKAIQKLVNGEEVVYETDNYAIFGNIIDQNLYQAIRGDLINIPLTCLAHIKRIYPTGTELMKNTIFSKIIDDNAKENMIASFLEMTKKYNFESEIITSIHGKPVYQVEIIALYQ